MTLFLKMPGRRYEISDIYVMALSFCLFFAVGKIFRAVIEKRESTKAIKMPNPKGGSMGLELSDDNELALTILSCIADNERYLVKDQRIVNLVFGLVKEKIKNESLVLTPNMMRLLALKLINTDQSFMVKIGNIVVSANNRVRLLSRVLGAAIIGFAGALFSALPYAILLLLSYFYATENCGYKCHDYFEHIPKEGPVRIYAEKPTGHLAIGGNDDARQVEIYTPSKVLDEVIISNTGGATIKKSYSNSRKKAKEVKFSDFKNKDPLLSAFKDAEEPVIPQKPCIMNDAHDIFAIRID